MNLGIALEPSVSGVESSDLTIVYALDDGSPSALSKVPAPSKVNTLKSCGFHHQ